MGAMGWRYQVKVTGAAGLLGLWAVATAGAARGEASRGALNRTAPDVARTAPAGFASAGLQPSDLPAGFSKPRTKVFTSYTPHMTFGGNKCDAWAPVTRSTWRGGLVSNSSKTNRSTSHFTLQAISECGFALSAVAVAHAAYLRGAEEAKTATKSVQGYRQLSLPRVGDEAVAYGAALPGSRVYGLFYLLFRRGATLISINYAGLGKGLPASTFTRIASAINGRL
jgi:hypothetical protein